MFSFNSLLHTRVLLDGFGTNGRREFGRVGHLGVGGGGANRSPGFAAGHAQCHRAACQQSENDRLNDFVKLFRFHKSPNKWVLCFVVLPAACP